MAPGGRPRSCPHPHPSDWRQRWRTRSAPAPRVAPSALGEQRGSSFCLGSLGESGFWRIFSPDSSGNKNLEGVDEVRKPGSGHGVGGERMKPGTSWASDFRVIEADRGWLLGRFILCYFFFSPVMGGLGRDSEGVFRVGPRGEQVPWRKDLLRSTSNMGG